MIPITLKPSGMRLHYLLYYHNNFVVFLFIFKRYFSGKGCSQKRKALYRGFQVSEMSPCWVYDSVGVMIMTIPNSEKKKN